ncbi:MAG: amidohydrolase, partial [Burkholderiales bacterium]
LMGRDRIGMLRCGWLADILVVNGDPTSDVRVLQDQARLTMIMKGGAFHKRTSIAREGTAP